MQEKLIKYLDQFQRVALLTGAGVSVDSGIPDFRDQENGLYNQGKYQDYYPETILSRQFFDRHQDIFWSYVDDFLLPDDTIEPNPAHYFAKYLANAGKLTGVITQNIDGLYQKAEVDVPELIEIHGNADFVYCNKCDAKYHLHDCPKDQKGIYRSPCHNFDLETDIVLYGDSFPFEAVQRYDRALQSAELLIVQGTSLKITYHLQRAIGFAGQVALLNREKVKLFNLWPYQEPREWDFEMIADFSEIF